MAKKAEEKPSEAIEPTPKNDALAIPDDIKEHLGAGTEGITSNDVRPPRLILAQAMSPQVKRTDAKYIEGLAEGLLFNDLTQEIYGEGPLKFCVISFLGQRFAEFDEDGLIKDANVKSDDPRTKWTSHCKECNHKYSEERSDRCPKCGSDDVESVKPAASRFYDYLLWLPETQEVVTFSLKNKQSATVGVNMNSLLKLPLNVGGVLVPNPPACARLFEMSTGAETNDKKQTWAVIKSVAPKGVTDEINRKICYELMKSFAKKNVIIEREPGEDRDEPFASDM